MSRDMSERCPETPHCGRYWIRTPNPLIRSSRRHLSQRIYNFLVFSKLFSVLRNSFSIVSMKPLRLCSPATKLRPLLTNPKKHVLEFLQFIHFGFLQLPTV